MGLCIHGRVYSGLCKMGGFGAVLFPCLLFSFIFRLLISAGRSLKDVYVLSSKGDNSVSPLSS